MWTGGICLLIIFSVIWVLLEAYNNKNILRGKQEAHRYKKNYFFLNKCWQRLADMFLDPEESKRWLIGNDMEALRELLRHWKQKNKFTQN